MLKTIIILMLLFLISCSTTSRRSDFIAGCYVGASSALGDVVNNTKIINFCIQSYDKNPKIQEKLDELSDLSKYLKEVEVEENVEESTYILL
jgi:hypothetical protein